MNEQRHCCPLSFLPGHSRVPLCLACLLLAAFPPAQPQAYCSLLGLRLQVTPHPLLLTYILSTLGLSAKHCPMGPLPSLPEPLPAFHWLTYA